MNTTFRKTSINKNDTSVIKNNIYDYLIFIVRICIDFVVRDIKVCKFRLNTKKSS